jgi:ankyrin repeat protein
MVRLRRRSAWSVLVLVVMSHHAAAEESPLIEAVKAGNAPLVQTLLKRGAKVNATLGDGATALHWAAHLDDRETADLLIRMGAQVNARNDLGITPLWIASTNGSARMIARLLQAGADPNAAPPTNVTPLMQAVRTGDVESVTLLLDAHGDANARERAGAQTALMWAVTQGHADVVRVLVAHGADVHARSSVWQQRVLTCCERYLGDSEGIVEVARGGFTPLLFAARLGELESARALIAGGADVNDTAADGSSALGLTSLSGHGELARFLLDRGADPNATRAGYAPLHAAVLRSDLKLATALLAHGARPNLQIANGTPTRRNEKTFAPDWAFDRAWIGATPLWLAARFAEVDIMRALVAGGADLTIPAKDGTIPFIVAAQAESVPARRGLSQAERERRAIEALKAALTLGVDVNASTADGDTALHVAASKKVNSIIEFLVQHGAALNARNKKGQTPLAIAMMEPEPPKGIAVIYSRQVNDASTADLLRKFGGTQ